jgi:hypothetical protein
LSGSDFRYFTLSLEFNLRIFFLILQQIAFGGSVYATRGKRVKGNFETLVFTYCSLAVPNKVVPVLN